jgi:hypothetical protein
MRPLFGALVLMLLVNATAIAPLVQVMFFESSQ